jgi:hypothetical protein
MCVLHADAASRVCDSTGSEQKSVRGGGQEPHHQLGQYISLFEQLAFDTL